VGWLLWKGTGEGTSTLIQTPIGGISKGCFVDKFTSEEIIQNLENITKKFGSNKQ